MSDATHNSIRGFTLIELVVAIGIFTTAVTLASGVFGHFVGTQRRDIAEQKLLEDVRFAMEIMERELRTGYGDTYAINASGSSLEFRNQERDCVRFELDDGAITRAQGSGGACNFTASSGERITSKDVVIDDLRFDPIGSGVVVEDDKLIRQGFVTIILNAKSSKNNSLPSFPIQSTVASKQQLLFEP